MPRFSPAAAVALLRRNGVPLAVLGIALIGVAWLYADDRHSREAAAQQRLNGLAAELELKLSAQVRMHEQMLRGAAGLFASTKSVSEAAFAAYVQQLELQQRFPGIRSIGYAPAIASAGDQSLIQVPVRYLEPAKPSNRNILGYDMFSESVRREAIERARDTGAPALSGRVTLRQDQNINSTQPGLLIYLPLYDRNAPIADIVQRRAALRGIMFMALHAEEIFSGLMEDEDELKDGTIEVFNGERADPAQRLFLSAARNGNALDSMKVSRKVAVGGRIWLLEIRGTPELLAGQRKERNLVIAFAALSALLLFGVMVFITRTRDHAQALAGRVIGELQGKQAELEHVQDSSPVGVYVLSPDGRRVIYANAKACAITGTDPLRPTQFQWAERLHPEDRDEAFSVWKTAFAAAGSFVHEHRRLRPDGSIIWVRVNCNPIIENGQLRGFTGLIEDITERHLAAQTLARNHAFLDDLINALPAPIFVKDTQHRWVHVNDEFCRLFGTGRAQLIGRNDADMLSAEVAAQRFREDDDVLESGAPLIVEVPQAFPDGSIRWGVKTKSPITFADGSRGVVGMFVDTHDRKQAQEALIQSQQRLRVLNDITGAVARGVALDEVLQIATQALSRAFPDMRVSYSNIDAQARASVLHSVPGGGTAGAGRHRARSAGNAGATGSISHADAGRDRGPRHLPARGAGARSASRGSAARRSWRRRSSSARS